MLEEARLNPEKECCGLLAGRDGAITAMFPAANALASQSAYEISPVDIFRLMREIRSAGLEMLGIYHSHPTGQNHPSKRDIESAYYPDAAYFILSPQASAINPIRAFAIRGGEVTDLAVEPL
jgi:proteasome lid subunit RPN8/RPN11